MPMNVKMPDGTIISNVPEGTTRSQLMARYQKFTSQPPVAPQAQAPMPPQQAAPAAPTQPPQEPSFMGGVEKALANRQQMSRDIESQAGKQTGFETGLQLTGKVGAGLAGDVLGEATKSVARAIPEPLKEGAKEIGSQWVKENPKMAEKLSTAAKFGVSMAEKGADIYKKWAEQNPRVARNLEAVVDIATVLPQTGLAAKATKIAGEATPVLGPLVKGLALPASKKLQVEATSKVMAAGKGIQEAKTAGVVIDPKLSSNFSNEIGRIVDKENPTKANASKNTLETIKRIQANIDRGDTSFDNLIIERNELQKARSMGGEEGNSAKATIDALDKHILEAYKKDAVVGGNKADIKKYQDKIAEYAEAKRYEGITEALDKGGDSASKIKSQLNKLANSEDFKYYPQKVQKFILQGAKGRTSGNVLDISAKIMGALPVVGPLTGMIIGGLAKKASGAIAKSTVGDILKALKEGK